MEGIFSEYVLLIMGASIILGITIEIIFSKRRKKKENKQ